MKLKENFLVNSLVKDLMQFFFFLYGMLCMNALPEGINSLHFTEVMTLLKLILRAEGARNKMWKGIKVSLPWVVGSEDSEFSHRAEYFKQEVGGVRNRIPKWDHSLPLNCKKKRYFNGRDKWDGVPSKAVHLHWP